MEPLPLTTRPPIKPVVVASSSTDIFKNTSDLINGDQIDLQDTTSETPLTTEPSSELLTKEHILKNESASGPEKNHPEDDPDNEQHSSTIRQRSASFLKNILKRAHSFKRSRSEEPPSTENSAQIDACKDEDVDKKQLSSKQRSAAFLKNILLKKTDSDKQEEEQTLHELESKKTSEESKASSNDQKDFEEDAEKLPKTKQRGFLKNIRSHLSKKSDEKANEAELSQDLKSDQGDLENTLEENHKRRSSGAGFLKNILERSHLTKKARSEEKGHTEVKFSQEVEDSEATENDNDVTVVDTKKPNVKQRSSAFVKNILDRSHLTKKDKDNTFEQTDESENLQAEEADEAEREHITPNQNIKQRSSAFVKNILERSHLTKKSNDIKCENNVEDNETKSVENYQLSNSMHGSTFFVDNLLEENQFKTGGADVTELEGSEPKESQQPSYEHNSTYFVEVKNINSDRVESYEVDISKCDQTDPDKVSLNNGRENPNKSIKQRSAAFVKNIRSHLTNKSEDQADEQDARENSTTHFDETDDTGELPTAKEGNQQKSIKQRSATFVSNVLERSHLKKKSAGKPEEQEEKEITELQFENSTETEPSDGLLEEDTTINVKQRSAAFMKNILERSHLTKKSEAKTHEEQVQVEVESTAASEETHDEIKHPNIKQRSATFVKSIIERSHLKKKSDTTESENIDNDDTDLAEHNSEEAESLNEPSKESKSSNVKQRSAAFVKNVLERSHLTKKPETISDVLNVESNAVTDSDAHFDCEEKKTVTVRERSTSFLKNILDRKHSTSKTQSEQTADEANQAAADDSEIASTHTNIKKPPAQCCHPIVEKLKTMADKQYNKGKSSIRKMTLKPDERLQLDEPQTILNLKESPRATRNKGFASYVVKHQDSDDVLEIVEMDESPSEVRRRREQEHAERLVSVLVPDEIIELPVHSNVELEENADAISIEPTINELLEEEFKSNPPPKKSPRKSKEHHYEDIDDGDPLVAELAEQLRREDETFARQMLETSSNVLRPLDSVESADSTEVATEPAKGALAPISSLDSTSSDDERRSRLPAVSEDQASLDVVLEILEPQDSSARKSNLKRDPSPGLEKKVTFSASTEAVEDIEEIMFTGGEQSEQQQVDGRWSKMR